METADEMRERHAREWAGMIAKTLSHNPKGGKYLASQIMTKWAVQYNYTVADLVGKSRTQDIAHVRQDCMRAIRTATTLSLPQIGRLFNRDHTTVLHGIKASEQRAAQ